MKLILAPLQGITNCVFRRIYHKHFPYFDCAVAPFVSPNAAEKSGGALFHDLLLKENENGISLEPQILLNNPDVFYPFLDKIYNLGYKKININMGCPAQIVVKKNKGSALLERLDLVDSILKRMSADSRFEFSVKLRLGVISKDSIFDVLPIIEKYEPSEIILHPRTAQMQYSGNADLKKFEEVAQKTTMKIVYNGDIFSISKYQKINSLFCGGISGVMIGRGVIVNPFLSGLIKGKGYTKNPKEKIRLFVDDLLEEYEKKYFGEIPVLGKMKELWRYLRFSFEGCDKYVKKILKSTAISSYRKHSDEVFEKTSFCEFPNVDNIDY
ncbi:MAG: tRNA-dihydrouridine synthase family protein [Chitinispirillales bacterium]|jgi:tRNA-dihydrouridine synthase|nr:tRNA-dihydrouridine synthase family protein [Chitinispirillales bacterium]